MSIHVWSSQSFDYEIEVLPPTEQSEMDKFMISNLKRINKLAEVYSTEVAK
jgi:hypothetical protein